MPKWKSRTTTRSKRAVEPEPESEVDPEEVPPPADEDANQRCMWRGDPKETFSDWTLEIVVKVNADEPSQPKRSKKKKTANGEGPSTELTERITTYHVHKSTLAYGARKSEYFANLFRAATEGRCSEGNESVSRIELEPLAALAFPALLDFIYAPELPLKVTIKTATALHSLGDYFDIRHLRWEARQFVLKNFALSNIDTIYEHATDLNNETILVLLSKFINENMLRIPPICDFVKKAKPGFWVKVLAADDENDNDEEWSIHWSKFVLEIQKYHGDDLDAETFDTLTASSKLPYVSKDVALKLCELDDKLHEGEALHASNGSLQERCATALSHTWDKIASNKDAARLLQNRKPAFLATLLVHSLKEAKSDLTSHEKKLKSSKQKESQARAEANSYQQQLNSTQQLQRQVRAESESKLCQATRVVSGFHPVPQGSQLYNTTNSPSTELQRHHNGASYVQNGMSMIVGGKYCPVYYYNGM